MFWGAMLMPPAVTIRSFFLSVVKRKPSESIVPMSPVANQPSGRKDLGGGLRLLEVARGDVGAPPEDLGVGRDLELHAGLGLADGAELEVVRVVERERGAGLGEQFAFQLPLFRAA